MKIVDIKRWAKEQGYNITKKEDDSINGATYYWSKTDDINITGVAQSVSKVAIAIYNQITENKWLDHQKEYDNKKTVTKFEISDY
jgi:hypothetical protein